MVYKETNNLGEISVNKATVSDIVVRSCKSWIYAGKLRIFPLKSIKKTGSGIYVNVHLSVAFGESIKDILETIANNIANEITNSLELEIDDIVLEIDSMFTSKGNLAKRDIVYSYKHGRKDE